jgi:hypothetical protein
MPSFLPAVVPSTTPPRRGMVCVPTTAAPPSCVSVGGAAAHAASRSALVRRGRDDVGAEAAVARAVGVGRVAPTQAQLPWWPQRVPQRIHFHYHAAPRFDPAGSASPPFHLSPANPPPVSVLKSSPPLASSTSTAAMPPHRPPREHEHQHQRVWFVVELCDRCVCVLSISCEIQCDVVPLSNND